MTRLRAVLFGLAALMLAGCGAEEIWATDEAVARASYSHPGPTTVTLLTAVSNRTGSGGHSALLIDGAERILYDPAGTWWHPDIPERNDRLFGMSPVYFDFYMDYHARETYHMLVQTVEVSPQTAAALIAGVTAQGASPKAYCARSVSTALAGVPGFEAIDETYFPVTLSRQFETIPGVVTTQVFDDDSDNNIELLQAQLRQQRSQAISAEVSN